MRPPQLRTLALAAAAAAALTTAGCGSNTDPALLVPTGVRPRPPVGEGAVSGTIVFDPAQAPDLSVAPYPLTRVELWRGTELAVEDTLDPGLRSFEFEGLGPGDYTVVAQADFFRRTSLPPVRVVSAPVDVGDLVLGIDGTDNPSEVHVLYDEAAPPRTIAFGNVRDTTGLLQSGPLGLWTFPQTFSRPPVLAAGVHRLRFILNRARSNPVNWSTATTDTIDAPAAFVPARRIEGAGVDFWVRVAAPTQFAIALDIRRRTISLNPLPVPVSFVTADRSPNP
jgi:hypothetical protein